MNAQGTMSWNRFSAFSSATVAALFYSFAITAWFSLTSAEMGLFNGWVSVALFSLLLPLFIRWSIKTNESTLGTKYGPFSSQDLRLNPLGGAVELPPLQPILEFEDDGGGGGLGVEWKGEQDDKDRRSAIASHLRGAPADHERGEASSHSGQRGWLWHGGGR